MTSAPTGHRPHNGIGRRSSELATEQTPLIQDGTGHSGDAVVDGKYEDQAKLPVSRLRGVCVALSLWLLIFIQSMSMIQGSIAANLDAYDLTTWFTTAYLIALSASPLYGRLATIFTPKALVIPASLLMALGAAAVAGARSFAVFIFGRALMGTGAAGIMTLTIILVLDMTDKRRRGIFIGLVNASFTVGVSFGAIVYGALRPAIGWRPIFWMQVPIALVGGIGLYFSIPNHPGSDNEDKSSSLSQKLLSIDYLGALLLLVTIFLFLYGLAGDIQPITLIISLTTLILFVLTEYFVARNPIIPLHVLSSRGVLLSCLAQVGTMTARWTVLFYSPIFVLATFGASPAGSGSVLIPTNFGFGLGGLLVGALHIRRAGSFWMPSVISLIGFTVSLFAVSIATVSDPSLPAFIILILVNGLFTGATLAYTLAHVLHHTHEGSQYITTSLLNTFRGFGGSFGTTLGGGIFVRSLRTALTNGFLDLDGGIELSPERRRLMSKLLGSPELVWHGNLSVAERAIALDGYAGALRSVWQAGAILGLVMIVIQAGTGWTGPEKPKTLADDPQRVLDADVDDEESAS